MYTKINNCVYFPTYLNSWSKYHHLLEEENMQQCSQVRRINKDTNGFQLTELLKICRNTVNFFTAWQCPHSFPKVLRGARGGLLSRLTHFSKITLYHQDADLQLRIILIWFYSKLLNTHYALWSIWKELNFIVVVYFYSNSGCKDLLISV